MVSKQRQKKVDSNRSLVQHTKWNTIGPTVHSRLEPFGLGNLDLSALESANMHCELVHWRAEQPLSCNSCFLFSVKKQDDTLHTVFAHLDVRGILDTGEYSRTSSWSGFFVNSRALMYEDGLGMLTDVTHVCGLAPGCGRRFLGTSQHERMKDRSHRGVHECTQVFTRKRL